MENHSVDLITVAQAYHWFDHQKFIKEAKRVAEKNATVAIWGYGLTTVNPTIDEVFMKYYRDILEDYWAPERRYVENYYEGLPLPFEQVIKEEFSMTKNWNLDEYLSYLSTWSAFQKYLKTNGQNPLDLVREEFTKTWGNAKERKEVVFPVFLKLGQI